MKLSRLFPLLALLLAASLHAENTHKEVRIASPWPAQNTIIAMLGYGDNIVGTSMIAKRIPLFRQSLPRIEKVAAVSVNSGHEINPEQIIALGVDMLFVPQNMVVPQQALLKQAGVQVLAFEANSLRALTQRVQQTAAVLGPDAQQKALAYQRYFDRNVALVTGRLKDLPASQRVSLYHSMGNPLTTTGRPSLNQDWIDLAGGKNIAENWFGEHQQNRSGEVALEKIVTANPAVIRSGQAWTRSFIIAFTLIRKECSGGAVKPAKRRCNFCGWRKRFILRDLLMWIYAKRRVSFIGSSLA